MKRFALALTIVVFAAGSGCCWHQPYGGGGCGPCGGYGGGYGAGYAPAAMPYGGSTCPGGNCAPNYQGMYPSGAYTGGATTAYMPYATTANIDYLPTY